jgi:hypothetical protein
MFTRLRSTSRPIRALHCATVAKPVLHILQITAISDIPNPIEQSHPVQADNIFDLPGASGNIGRLDQQNSTSSVRIVLMILLQPRVGMQILAGNGCSLRHR